MANTVIQMANYLDVLLKKLPDMVEVKFKKDNKFFSGIVQKKDNEKFYVTVEYAKGGGFQGYDMDSLTDQIGYSSTPSMIQPYDSMVDIIAFQKITKKAIDRSASPESIKALAAKLYTDVSENLVKHIKFHWYLPATNNVLATYTDGGSGTTISTSGTSIALNATPTGSTPSYGAWFLRIGMVVDLYEGSTKKGTAIVTGINSDRKTVTLAAIGSNISITASADVNIYAQGMYGKTVNSFGFIASTSRTLHNIDSSSNAFWNGTVVDAGGSANLTVQKIRDLLYEIENLPYDVDVTKYNVAFTTRKQLEKLEADIIDSVTYQISSATKKDLDYGNFYITVDGVDVYYDPLVPPGVLYLPHFDYLEFKYAKKPEWMKLGGEILHPDSLSTPQVLRAVLTYTGQFACSLPPVQGKIIKMANDFDFS